MCVCASLEDDINTRIHRCRCVYVSVCMVWVCAGTKLSTNFPCLPRETCKARALEIVPNEEKRLSNEYMQKKIPHRNRYYTEIQNNTLP